MVPAEGLEPPHSYEYQILSLARLPIPPRRQPIKNEVIRTSADGKYFGRTQINGKVISQSEALILEMVSDAHTSCGFVFD